jgi:hypothetical protein
VNRKLNYVANFGAAEPPSRENFNLEEYIFPPPPFFFLVGRQPIIKAVLIDNNAA